ncbi:hypothetical protein MR988_04160 [bacterium]|nr:hypothetical protein [bacterium]MDY3861647.1 hypothetical protein [Ruminococcus sp.]
MTFKIGFTAESKNENQAENIDENIAVANNETAQAKKSVVDVFFPERGLTCSYYNDSFDLHKGDMVFVDGKLEGKRGYVVGVNYNFKIKLSDYKRVISVADTRVQGRLYISGSHFLVFDRRVIPSEKVITWFKAPSDDEEFAYGGDGEGFSLDNLDGMNVSGAVAERGYNYYMENKVVYLCVDGNKGFAIVTGTESYEVEFEYNNGEISNLVCSCYCTFNCKHEFAVMLQLKDLLDFIENNYGDEYEKSGYFAAVSKGALFQFAIDTKSKGGFVLE